jgi:hypothetical protein
MKVMPLPTEPADLQLRRKILWVDPVRLLDMMFGPQPEDSVLLTRVNVPDGAHVHGVHFSFERNAFGFTIMHPEFPIVSWGTMPAELKCEYKVVKLEPKKS